MFVCCGCTRQTQHARLEGGVVVSITPNAPLADTKRRALDARGSLRGVWTEAQWQVLVLRWLGRSRV